MRTHGINYSLWESTAIKFRRWKRWNQWWCHLDPWWHRRHPLRSRLHSVAVLQVRRDFWILLKPSQSYALFIYFLFRLYCNFLVVLRKKNKGGINTLVLGHFFLIIVILKAKACSFLLWNNFAGKLHSLKSTLCIKW